MSMWGLGWGAFLGFVLGGFSVIGAFIGAILGLGMAMTLERQVRDILEQQPKKAAKPSPQTSPQPSSPSTQQATPEPSRTPIPRPVPEAFTTLFPPLSSVQADSVYPPETTISPEPEPPRVSAAPIWASTQAAPSATDWRGREIRAAVKPKASISNKKEESPGDVFGQWFSGGNLLIKVGLVVLFIGLSFLARYAIVSGFISLEMRFVAIGCVGLVLLGLGYFKRHERPDFGVAMQGAGVAVLYLCIYAAVRLYPVLSPASAFGMMVVVVTVGVVLAYQQDAKALALASFLGGFAVPLLLASGRGDHITLFGYYAVLNVAILFFAIQKGWRSLNLLGFLATFGTTGVWGYWRYEPAQYASTQPFLIFFVLNYIAVAMGYARQTLQNGQRAVDSTLIFGVALAGFGLQAELTESLHFGQAHSSVAFALGYLALGLWVRAKGQNYRLLASCFTAIGIGFATLAVPLYLDAKWTSGVWALEGAAAYWVGMRQSRWLPRALGVLLQLVAAVMYGWARPVNVSELYLMSPAVMGVLFIAVPSMAIAWWSRQTPPTNGNAWAMAYASLEKSLSTVGYMYAMAFWALAIYLELNRVLPMSAAQSVPVYAYDINHRALWAMLACVLTAWLSTQWACKGNWSVAKWLGQLVIVPMLATQLLEMAADRSVVTAPAALIWIVALVLFYYQMYVHDTHMEDTRTGRAALRPFSAPLASINHTLGVLLVVLLLADALHYNLDRAQLAHTNWAGVAYLGSAALFLILLTRWSASVTTHRAPSWPLRRFASAYYSDAALPVAIAIAFGALALTISSNGLTRPLPYWPLFNPTDLCIATALVALAFWRNRVMGRPGAAITSAAVHEKLWFEAWAGLCFVALNTVWLRMAHHFFDVEWYKVALFHSFIVQTGYAILWTLMAMVAMLYGHAHKMRRLWGVGAGLLVLVVLKLMVVDLSNSGGAERIVAFIGVGVLMLVIGYFAPMPPKNAREVES